MAKRKLPQEFKNFGDLFDTLARRHGSYQAFQDFLDLFINGWSLDYNPNLQVTRDRYTPKERTQFGRLMQESILTLNQQIKTDTDYYDLFGTFYEAEGLTNKHFAQFFTPLPICQFMAQIVDPQSKASFSDPCCGSGRFSLATNSVTLGLFHVLVDIDYTCARMAALNLTLHGINGIVICDNALIPERDFKGAFRVNRLLHHTGVPQIDFISDIKEAYTIAGQWLKHRPKTEANGQKKPTGQSVADVAQAIMDQSGQFKLF